MGAIYIIMKGRGQSNKIPTPKTRKSVGRIASSKLKHASVAYGLTRKNRVSNVLRVACRDPVRCIALGKYQPMINQLFRGFQDWTDARIDDIVRVGGESVNGFALKIPFTKQGYTVQTILKNALTAQSDNLVYEYLVGKKFINDQSIRFPCFLETYSLHKYKHSGFAYAMKTYSDDYLPRFEPIPLSDMLDPAAEVDWADACLNSERYSILIQYFNNVQSFRTHFDTGYENFKYDVLQILYQVYYVLDTLKDVYTHYDLHGNNVLLYKPFQGHTYMKMHYHQPDETVKIIYSEWVVKLIDYGRNHFKTDTCSTESTINSIMRMNECTDKPSLSYVKGKYDSSPVHSYIDPTISNSSHDLQLTRECIEYLKLYNINVDGIDVREFGFPIKPSRANDDTIYNVTDMRRVLELDFYHQLMSKNKSKKYHNWTCGGEMHIYPDGRPYTVTLHTVPDSLESNTIQPDPIKKRLTVRLDFDVIHELSDHTRLKLDKDKLNIVFQWVFNVLDKYNQKDAYRFTLIFYMWLYFAQEPFLNMTRATAQLYACICMQIVNPQTFSLRDWVYLTDGAYEIDQIKEEYENASAHMKNIQFELIDAHRAIVMSTERINKNFKKNVIRPLIQSVFPDSV